MYLELLDAFRQDKDKALCFEKDFHMAANGHKIVAQQIFGEMEGDLK
jgi:hypothetical protein